MFKTIVIAAIAAFTTETQAVQIKSQAEIDAVVQNYLQAEEGSEAEWGFLKNIVNIDKFFDSGVKAWEFKWHRQKLMFNLTFNSI